MGRGVEPRQLPPLRETGRVDVGSRDEVPTLVGEGHDQSRTKRPPPESLPGGVGERDHVTTDGPTEGIGTEDSVVKVQ